MQLDDLRNQLTDDASFDHRPFHTLLTQGDQLIWVGEKVFADSRVGVYFTPGDEDNLLAQHLLARDALAAIPPRSGVGHEAALQTRAEPVWQKTFNKYHVTHLVVRLATRRDYDIFADILQDSVNWEWTSLGAAAAVFYRNDEVDVPQLDEYVKAHAIDFRKRVYRDEREDAAGAMEFSGRDRAIRPPTFYQRYFWTSRHQSSGDIHEALHLAVMATYPGLPRHMDQSRAAMALLAIRRAQAGLARDPDDVNGYLALGQAYDFLARIEATAVMNGSRPARVGMRYLQAVGAYNQVLVGAPDSLAAHGALKRIYSEAGKLDLALRHSEAYEQALSANPVENAEVLSGVGSQLMHLRQMMETVEDQMAQRAAMDSDPTRLWQGYFQSAAACWRRLREIERGGASVMRDPGPNNSAS